MQANLVETFTEAEAFMRWLSERRPILAIDTETGGLDWWRDALRLVQFGDTQTGWAIPFNLWGGLALDATRLYKDPIVFHNCKFDVRYLNVNGANLSYRQVHDTRVMSMLLEPHKRSGLKEMSTRYLGNNSDDWEGELHRSMTLGKWDWATVPVTLEAYWQYACMDTMLTARMYEILYPQITGRLKDVYELEIAVIQIIDEMEQRGIHVDIPYCEKQYSIYTEAADTLEDWCINTYGFGPGSNAKIAAQLTRDGIPLTKATAGGSLSVDEEVLRDIEHPLAEAVLKARKARKYANSYFRSYIDMSDSGLLHPDVNTLGARTGRMSISRPALQQIPRESVLRNAFIPSPGNRLVSVDYDQIEMRLFTHYCQDAGLIAAFNSPGDFFINAANTLYSEPVTDKKDPRRQLTKNASYATIYGSGARKFAQTAKVPEAEGIEFMLRYHAAFPGVKQFTASVIELGKKRFVEEGNAYITTSLGRKEPSGEDDLYKLVNYLVQGSAADTFKQALVRLDEHGYTDRFVLPVHDEVVFDVPEVDALQFAKEVAEVMSDDSLTIPLTCGYDILERWGDKYV